MKIQSLLNPFCKSTSRAHHTSHSSNRSSSPSNPLLAPISTQKRAYSPLPKRHKIPKDAPIFSEGNKVVGHVNYPPHEAGQNTDLEAQHRRFQIYPLGEIYRKGVRHIPYNSDKKDFLEKTGREAFEMFQYTYCVPGEDKEYVVVWDYNIGLVRMTPFFKSLKYSKTVPAKALRENPGMKDISYSITGGALVCQGYWMPYQAAKAIAATFCYHIRWALTPVFGNDFPSLCLAPEHPNYAKFAIDPDIVWECTNETDRFRVKGAAYKFATTTPLPEEHTSKPQFGVPYWAPKETKLTMPRSSEDESGYCTESDQSEKCFSPQVSPRSITWASVHRSQSSISPPRFHSPLCNPPNKHPTPLFPVLPKSIPSSYYDESPRSKRTLSKINIGDDEANHSRHTPAMGTTPHSNTATKMGDIETSAHSIKDLDAAKIILQLSVADRSLPPAKRTRCSSKY